MSKLCSGEQGGVTMALSRWNSARIQPSEFQPWSGSLQARNYTPTFPLSTLEVKKTTGWGVKMSVDRHGRRYVTLGGWGGRQTLSEC